MRARSECCVPKSNGESLDMSMRVFSLHLSLWYGCLFPLDCRGRFVGDVVDHAGDLRYLVRYS